MISIITCVSSLLHFLVDDHIILVRRLQDLTAQLALAFRLVAWDRRLRRLSWDSEHRGLYQGLRVRHLWLWVELRSRFLRVLPVLKGAQDGDFLPLLAGGNPLWSTLEEVHRLATLLYSNIMVGWMKNDQEYLHDRYGIDFSSSSQNLEISMVYSF